MNKEERKARAVIATHNHYKARAADRHWEGELKRQVKDLKEVLNQPTSTALNLLATLSGANFSCTPDTVTTKGTTREVSREFLDNFLRALRKEIAFLMEKG